MSRALRYPAWAAALALAAAVVAPGSAQVPPPADKPEPGVAGGDSPPAPGRSEAQ